MFSNIIKKFGSTNKNATISEQMDNIALISDNYLIEFMGERDSSPCECCGEITTGIWGRAFLENSEVALYYICWTKNEYEQKGATYNIIYRNYDKENRQDAMIAIDYFNNDNGVGFGILDAETNNLINTSQKLIKLDRDEILGMPFEPKLWALVDAIFLNDNRIGG